MAVDGDAAPLAIATKRNGLVRRMRFLVATLVVWLFLFYNIERLSASTDITGAAYFLVPVAGAFTLLAPRVIHVPLAASLTITTAALLGLKAAWWREWGSSLPCTLIEVGTVWLTVILAQRVSDGIGEFEDAVQHISVGAVGHPVDTATDGREEMYRELKRARHHRRPLGLMSIGLNDDSIQVALDKIVREVQQAMMKQYILSGIAGTLGDIFEDYDVVARDNDHFLALLPETNGEQLALIAEQVRRTVAERLGVTLQIGLASFPHDATTFDGLVEKAIRTMKQSGRGTKEEQNGTGRRSHSAGDRPPDNIPHR